MACACVFVIAFLLLADTWTTLMVCGCVAMTLIDVIGALNFWNVTLDPFSSVDICLSVGLCIDYPVHIAHSFLVATGNKKWHYIFATFFICSLCNATTIKNFTYFYRNKCEKGTDQSVKYMSGNTEWWLHNIFGSCCNGEFKHTCFPNIFQGVFPNSCVWAISWRYFSPRITQLDWK